MNKNFNIITCKDLKNHQSSKDTDSIGIICISLILDWIEYKQLFDKICTSLASEKSYGSN